MNQEKGSALISVLIILLLITVLGVIAVRQGLTSLNIATAASANMLLEQATDVALDKLENTDITVNVSGGGPLGYLRLEGNLGKEYIFCYRPTQNTPRMFNINKDSILLPTGGVEGDVSGFCDVSKPEDYTSARSAVVTQVAVVRPVRPAIAPPFEFFEKGTDPDTVKRPVQQRYVAYVTSVAPSLSNASDASINECLRLPNDEETVASAGKPNAVADCLFERGIPSNTQVQEYVLGGEVEVNIIN